MLARIAVVAYVAGFRGVDAVVATKLAVLTGVPCRASLAEDDVSGDYVFAWRGRGSGELVILRLIWADLFGEGDEGKGKLITS